MYGSKLKTLRKFVNFLLQFPCHVLYSASNPKDNYDTSENVFMLPLNVFMSITSYFESKCRY